MRGLAEMLERRMFLSGVTLITHGWNSDTDSWVSEMANAVARAAAAPSGDPSTVAQYTLNAVTGSPIAIQPPVRDAGSADWGSSGDAIIKLDWGPLSGGLFSGTPTGSVANAYADYLLTQTIDGHSLFEQPVHLIGHSRGASLDTQLARRLAERGIWVDHFTGLDPHPVDGVNEDIGGMNFGDTPMALWSNVQFADNYWRTDSSALDFNGELVTGAANVNFTDSILEANATGYTYSHLYTHLWYHGTIGPQASPFPPYPNGDGDATITSPSAYYSGSSAQPLRTASGFYYSNTVNGQRPAGGVGVAFGGSGERSNVTPMGLQWPNVGDLSLRHNPSGVLSAGERLFVSYRYQDSDSAATITWFADADENPYNANQQQLPVPQGVSSSAGVLKGLYHGSTAGLNAGAWNIYARISDANSQTRYAYLPQSITITNAAPVPTLSSGPPAAGAIAGGSVDVYSFAANLGDTFSLTMDDQASVIEPQLDLYGPSGSLLTTVSGASIATINPMLAGATGLYYVVARDQGDDESGAYSLNLSLTPSWIAAPAGSFTLSGSGAGQTLTITGGQVALTGDTSSTHPGLAVVVNTGATLNLDASQHLAALSVAGQLDVRGQSLEINHTGASPIGSWNGSAYDGVTGMIQSGRVLSSSATSSLYAVGVRDVDADTARLQFTYGGDANLDGKLNIDDYTKIDQGIAAQMTGWNNGDFNYDGKINIDDYTTIIDSNIGNQGPPITNVQAALSNPAPVVVNRPSLVWGESEARDEESPSAELLA